MSPNRKNILALFFLAFFFASCEKDPFDFRSKYVGDYNFSIHNRSWANGTIPIDTTYTATGRVDYDSDINYIQVIYSNSDRPDKYKIYEDGTIGPCEGEFESKNKLFINCSQYSPGGGYSNTIIGERQ